MPRRSTDYSSVNEYTINGKKWKTSTVEMFDAGNGVKMYLKKCDDPRRGPYIIHIDIKGNHFYAPLSSGDDDRLAMVFSYLKIFSDLGGIDLLMAALKYVGLKETTFCRIKTGSKHKIIDKEKKPLNQVYNYCGGTGSMATVDEDAYLAKTKILHQDTDVQDISKMRNFKLGGKDCAVDTCIATLDGPGGISVSIYDLKSHNKFFTGKAVNKKFLIAFKLNGYSFYTKEVGRDVAYQFMWKFLQLSKYSLLQGAELLNEVFKYLGLTNIQINLITGQDGRSVFSSTKLFVYDAIANYGSKLENVVKPVKEVFETLTGGGLSVKKAMQSGKVVGVDVDDVDTVDVDTVDVDTVDVDTVDVDTVDVDTVDIDTVDVDTVDVDTVDVDTVDVDTPVVEASKDKITVVRPDRNFDNSTLLQPRPEPRSKGTTSVSVFRDDSKEKTAQGYWDTITSKLSNARDWAADNPIPTAIAVGVVACASYLVYQWCTTPSKPAPNDDVISDTQRVVEVDDGEIDTGSFDDVSGGDVSGSGSDNDSDDHMDDQSGVQIAVDAGRASPRGVEADDLPNETRVIMAIREEEGEERDERDLGMVEPVMVMREITPADELSSDTPQVVINELVVEAHEDVHDVEQIHRASGADRAHLPAVRFRDVMAAEEEVPAEANRYPTGMHGHFLGGGRERVAHHPQVRRVGAHSVNDIVDRALENGGYANNFSQRGMGRRR